MPEASVSPAAMEYVRETVRLWLGLPRDRATDVPTLPAKLARLLLRTEEYEQSHRDQWGNWSFSLSESFREGKLWIPQIDEWLDTQRRALEDRGVELEPLWPEKHSFAVCLTHDVDRLTPTWSRRERWRNFKQALFSRDSSRLEHRNPMRLARLLRLVKGTARPNLAETIERVVEIEKRYGATSSFFFTVYPVKTGGIYDCIYRFSDPFTFRQRPVTVAAVMKELLAEGFDIGLHGSYFSATDGEMLKTQKQRIEDALDAEITTTRQHYLRWRTPLTPVLQAEAGFLADSTQGFNRNIGYRCGTSLPFDFWDGDNDRALPLLEVPLIIQEGALFSATGLEYDEAMTKEVLLSFIEQSRATSGCLTLLFHPEYFTQPRQASLYEWCLEQCRSRGAWLTSLGGIERWWRERQHRLTGPP